MSGGGTSVASGPRWGLILGGAALIGGIAIFAGTRGGSDTEVVAQDEDDEDEVASGDADDFSEDSDEPEETARPAPVAKAADLEDVEEEAAVDLDSLLADLKGDDAQVAHKAKRAIEENDLKEEAIPVLWQIVKTQDAYKRQQAKGFLKDWNVPLTYDRSTARETKKASGRPDWLDASLEVDGDDLVVTMSFWYGEDLFGSEHEPWVELSASGGTLSKPTRVKIVPTEGDNELRETVAEGIGPGEYRASVLLWGHNDATQTQHNISGPSLTVVKP